MSDAIPVPQGVVQTVEEYVYSELSNAEKYENRTPLDESGIWSLHRLAAQIYAMGFDAGERIEHERGRAERQRMRDTTRATQEGKQP